MSKKPSESDIREGIQKTAADITRHNGGNYTDTERQVRENYIESEKRGK